jgi:hypothetical protein
MRLLWQVEQTALNRPAFRWAPPTPSFGLPGHDQLESNGRTADRLEIEKDLLLGLRGETRRSDQAPRIPTRRQIQGEALTGSERDRVILSMTWTLDAAPEEIHDAVVRVRTNPVIEIPIVEQRQVLPLDCPKPRARVTLAWIHPANRDT